MGRFKDKYFTDTEAENALEDNMGYDNNMSGVLFKNDRATKDTHPGYTGSCEIDGTEYWISAWVKSGKKGKFFSLAFKAKDEAPSRRQRSPQHEEEFDDNIPF